MRSEQHTCPMCGNRFDPLIHSACSNCPLHTGCQMICCPACGYSEVDLGGSKLVEMWIKMAGRLRRLNWGRGRNPLPPAAETTHDRQVGGHQPGFGVDRGRRPSFQTLATAPRGEQVNVIGFGDGLPPDRRAQLQAYGVLPGAQVRVLQHRPVTVIQIEHTELALEAELATEVKVG